MNDKFAKYIPKRSVIILMHFEIQTIFLEIESNFVSDFFEENI
jgi:hypothetical protein